MPVCNLVCLMPVCNFCVNISVVIVAFRIIVQSSVQRCKHTFNTVWAGLLSRYSDWLRAGRSGDRIPVGGEIFRTCPYRPWGPPSLMYNGYRVFPGGKKWPGREADPHPLLVPWSWNATAIPLLPLWAVRPVQSLSACTRVTFTFTFTLWAAELARHFSLRFLYLLPDEKQEYI